MSLSRVEARAEEALDSDVDGRAGVSVHREVDYAVCPDAENRDKMQSAVVDRGPDEVLSGRGEGVVRHDAVCVQG
jgi:hypothetical protein